MMTNEKRIEIVRTAHEKMSLSEIGDIIHVGNSTVSAFLKGKPHTANLTIDERLFKQLENAIK